ncbi:MULTISPECIES: hypothetical protein [Enterobacteriaceae]|uniref:hypothetical protein n=1 Tax=Enterobacteriaceae TaxID=543 RepID=UPI00125CE64F|nr:MULTISPECIES: hypothetical protein [Enterobacteriaceae]MBK4555595.1 hypothetical protein [Enterobacter hormaechei]MBK4631727.1 hypothetical protein [Enterobacter hormaechei]MCM7069672.1 hypothetical protein [Enterobacter hormaechei]MDM3414551.1 hypothetical protein [Citrobacter sp. Cb021]QFH87394.1 hypothetical protein FR760_22185 [Enterobacter hormaechei]
MMKDNRMKVFLKRYKWAICFIWTLSGLVFWTSAGYLASVENADLPGPVFFRAAGICWLMLHGLPVAVAVIVFRL